MPTKICPDCGGTVSEARNDCIHCGHIFNPKVRINFALVGVWFFLGFTVLAYVINMIISLRVGGTLKWMFEYIMYGYIGGFICMGVGIIGFIISFCFLCKNKEIKAKVSRIISLLLLLTTLFATFAPVIFYDPLTYTKNDNNTCTVSHCSTNYSGEIKIPSTYNGLPVERIGDRAFAFCTNVTSIEIGEGITVLGDFHTFYGCTSLESVVIPASTTCIGIYAFTECSSLTSVYYKGTEADWQAITIVASDDDEIYKATRYYYSESEPTTEGNYWYYDADGNVAVWQ